MKPHDDATSDADGSPVALPLTDPGRLVEI
jgi:hypothetical protein